ncbi:uncharacterized protein LOC129185681 [Dunckerocampus dactyliophorus]|uniref:uncharacterized protein LOC129185681 n=1 Tax=Dunckerocampus dactyliophorus TaxID=161453 RepID=UPI00240683FB|nr:uncharacterized protein LOC129185681 [Dunckerocampus dactyliophorus]
MIAMNCLHILLSYFTCSIESHKHSTFKWHPNPSHSQQQVSQSGGPKPPPLLTAMASTPSASALTSVLRCRGKFLARNPPAKRTATAALSPALASRHRRDLSADHPRSGRSRVWAFVHGERCVLAVRQNCSPAGKVISGVELRHPRGAARPSAPRGLTVTTRQPGEAHQPDGVLQPLRHARACQVKFLIQDARQPSCDVWRVSVIQAGDSLRNTCWALKLLLTQAVFRKMATLCSSTRGRSDKEKTADVTNDALQNVPQAANGPPRAALCTPPLKNVR